MNRTERSGDLEEILRVGMESHQASVWTTLPGIVISFDPGAWTCKVQPAISGIAIDETGARSELRMPVLVDCPVVFPSGGGCTLTFPIKAGDECLVAFSARCIDSWWQLGGVQGQAEIRMHDLSDGFVIPGPRSQPRTFAIDTSAAQLRSDDGAAFVEINPSSHKIKAQTSGDIEATAAGQITMTAPVVAINAPIIILNGQVTQGKGSNGGSMQLQGPVDVINDVTAGGKSLINHQHDVKNVQGGTSTITSEKTK